MIQRAVKVVRPRENALHIGNATCVPGEDTVEVTRSAKHTFQAPNFTRVPLEGLVESASFSEST